MSRQLRIASTFSLAATLALALFAATGGSEAVREKLTGAPAFAEAPALMPDLPALSL
jgi:hypothetical protein